MTYKYKLSFNSDFGQLTAVNKWFDEEGITHSSFNKIEHDFDMWCVIYSDRDIASLRRAMPRNSKIILEQIKTDE